MKNNHSKKTSAIPLVDLAIQHKALRREIAQAIQEVVDASSFIGGPQVKKFEEEFAAYCGTRFGIGVASGTAALELTMEAMGIGPGDEVITTPFTFIATSEAITRVGAQVIFVDVEEDSATIDPRLIAAAITPKTRAIIVVHLFGQCADMDPILEIGKLRKVAIIEDSAQAHGALYKNRKAGSMGDAATFSFYPAKNIGAMGDAGIVLTNRQDWADHIRRLSDHGRSDKYLHGEEGYNYRLDSLQAAILSVKLKHLETWNKKRRAVAEIYGRLFRGAAIGLPHEKKGNRHVYHQYVVRHPQRDELRSALGREGISTGIHYPIPLHLQPAYLRLGLKEGSYPVSERLAKEVLSLPMYPELKATQVKRVAQALFKMFPNNGERPPVDADAKTREFPDVIS